MFAHFVYWMQPDNFPSRRTSMFVQFWTDGFQFSHQINLFEAEQLDQTENLSPFYLKYLFFMFFGLH